MENNEHEKTPPAAPETGLGSTPRVIGVDSGVQVEYENLRRATAGRPEYPWWLHACGYVEIGPRDGTPPPTGPCVKCDDDNGTWQALYTIGGA